MRYIVALVIGILCFSFHPSEKGHFFNDACASDKIGAVTGLPIPRYVSLRSSKARARTGPALRYPIQWVYRRAGLPVEITAEYEAWRQIKDVDGTITWMHSSLLSGKRTAYIKVKDLELDTINAYKRPDNASRRILKIEPNALGEIKKCVNSHCLLDFKAYRGWVEKKYIWGIYQNEVIE